MSNSTSILIHRSRGAYHFPYLIVLQHNSIPAYLSEVLAAPLAPLRGVSNDRLQPRIEVGGRTLLVLVPLLRRVSVRRLLKPVEEVVADRDRIIAALDLLFVGS